MSSVPPPPVVSAAWRALRRQTIPNFTDSQNRPRPIPLLIEGEGAVASHCLRLVVTLSEETYTLLLLLFVLSAASATNQFKIPNSKFIIHQGRGRWAAPFVLSCSCGTVTFTLFPALAGWGFRLACLPLRDKVSLFGFYCSGDSGSPFSGQTEWCRECK